jgi:hypothetical protein
MPSSHERTDAIAMTGISENTEMTTAHDGSGQDIQNNGKHFLSLIRRVLRELKIRNREF